jgi:hypothetical protein
VANLPAISKTANPSGVTGLKSDVQSVVSSVGACTASLFRALQAYFAGLLL